VLSGGAFRPENITFTHDPPASLEVHRRVLGPAIDFSQEANCMVCRASDLDMPIPAADPALNREVKRWLDMQLANLRDDPAREAREIVRMLLPSGLCTADRVARHFGVHQRTLNRHLAAGGESVKEIINGVRVELAQEYLTNSKRKLYEVAELLGFSSAGAFSRWFLDQFGRTASDWAASYRAGKATAGPGPHDK
jgi:AraC-like DNA-binding protein